MTRLDAVILCGGFGTRISEYTDTIPKPMIEVGGKPILWHIMKMYSKYDYNNFVVALGYKGEIIKKYFSNLNEKWNIELVDTGQDTMTGGRIKRLQSFIGNETCMLTYGDGLADINLKKLLTFHKSHGKMVTVTAVHPPARFGAIQVEGNLVKSFKEKVRMNEGWINGGFLVIEPKFFNLIKDDSTYLEREPLEKAAENGDMFAYKHEGFWHCMDTKRDKDNLEELYSKGAPWLL